MEHLGLTYISFCQKTIRHFKLLVFVCSAVFGDIEYRCKDLIRLIVIVCWNWVSIEPFLFGFGTFWLKFLNELLRKYLNIYGDLGTLLVGKTTFILKCFVFVTWPLVGILDENCKLRKFEFVSVVAWMK